MQDAALLRSKQLNVHDTPPQKSRHSEHSFVITQRIQYTLPTGLGQIHIFIGEHTAILTRPQIELRNLSQFIRKRKHPTDSWQALQCHAKTICTSIAIESLRPIGMNILILPPPRRGSTLCLPCDLYLPFSSCLPCSPYQPSTSLLLLNDLLWPI